MTAALAPASPVERERLRARIRWLLLARVLIVTLFLGATAFANLRAEVEPSAHLRALVALIVVAYGFSVGSALVLPRTVHLGGFSLFQILFDVTLISVAILFTGGLGSPMAVWYNLAIVGAALLLYGPGAFAAATCASIGYGVLMNLLYYDVLPGWLALSATHAPEAGLAVVFRIAANIASFFSIAFLSTVLVERIARAEHELEQTAADLHRLEALQGALIQNLESAVLTIATSGVIESASQNVEAILGRGPGDIVGRNLTEVLPVLRPALGSRKLLSPVATPLELSYRIDGGGDAAERTLRCRRAPLNDTYQNPIGTLLILQDVTAIKELERKVADGEPVDLAANVPAVDGAIPGMIGQSRPIAEVVRLIEKAAPTNATILLRGESGTGKELAASAVHALSARHDKPMIVVNCAAIPENLMESELFGHVRGAYTGAVSDRPGLFRAADGGTIFLDEIGDLPHPLQVKLLRVLQERAFTPVGSQTQVVVDVRIIAATNRDLHADVATGRFREDLYYRLNVIEIVLPPLRERSEDLPVLVQHFVARFSEGLGKSCKRVSGAAMKRLLDYEYPGNVRELENVIEHAVALAAGDVIEAGDLPGPLQNGSAAAAAGERSAKSGVEVMQAAGSNLDLELEQVERQLIFDALRLAGGVRKRAAELLGINYRSLRHRLSKYGVGEEPEDGYNKVARR